MVLETINDKAKYPLIRFNGTLYSDAAIASLCNHDIFIHCEVAYAYWCDKTKALKGLAADLIA